MTSKKIGLYLGIGILYFILALPFAGLHFSDGYSEIRFTSLLPMAAGLLCGFPGALSCALGNLLGDLCTGPDIYCIFGFAGNFLMAWAALQAVAHPVLRGTAGAAIPGVFRLHSQIRGCLPHRKLRLRGRDRSGRSAFFQGFPSEPFFSLWRSNTTTFPFWEACSSSKSASRFFA